MKRRYKLWCALALLIAFHLFVLFAGFFAPYSYFAQDRDLPYASPMGIHFFDARGEFHVRPFVYSLQDDAQAPGTYRIDEAHLYPVHFFVRGSSYKVAGLFRSRIHFFGVETPGRIFLMGTDGYGRDQLTRFLYGGQVSLAAGLIAAGLSVFL